MYRIFISLKPLKACFFQTIIFHSSGCRGLLPWPFRNGIKKKVITTYKTYPKLLCFSQIQVKEVGFSIQLFLHNMTMNAMQPLVFEIIDWILHDFHHVLKMTWDLHTNSWWECKKLCYITIQKSRYFKSSMSFIQMDVTH